MSQYKRIVRIFLANVFIIVTLVTILVPMLVLPPLERWKSTCFP